MTHDEKPMSTEGRGHLHFDSLVREKFEFLSGLGFLEFESLPTLVRYRNDGVEPHGKEEKKILHQWLKTV